MEAWSPLLLLLIAASAATTTAQVTNVYCFSNTTYAPNSAFSTGLQTALSTLSAASSAAKFSNTTVSSSVYALYFCRYDLPLSDCHACVANATNYIVSLCPAQTEAVIWYERCTLRYGAAPLNHLDSMYYFAWGGALVSLQFADYNATLASTLRETVDRAVNGSAVKYFATGEGSYGKNQKVRSLVQCSPDLSAADCGACLTEAFDLMEENCVGGDWGMVFKSSCMMRYGVAPFYALGNSSGAGSAESPTPATSISGGSGSSTGASVTSASSSALVSQRYGEVARRVISGALLVLCIPHLIL